MIVDRIHAYLSSQGTTINEAILNDVGNLARNAFMRQFGEREEKAKTLRLSSIGRCLRQQAYNVLGFEVNGKEIDSRARMVFFQGDMAEIAIIQLAKVAGCEMTACGANQEVIELDGVTGHPDGILWESPGTYLVEAKSMSSFGFNEFERGVIDQGYIYQIQAYMDALHLSDAIVVALNKDAGVLAEQIIHKDELIVADIKERIAMLKAVTPETLPDRPYKPNEKGFYPWQCRFCAHYKTCLPETELFLVKNAYKLRAKDHGKTLQPLS